MDAALREHLRPNRVYRSRVLDAPITTSAIERQSELLALIGRADDAGDGWNERARVLGHELLAALAGIGPPAAGATRAGPAHAAEAHTAVSADTRSAGGAASVERKSPAAPAAGSETERDSEQEWPTRKTH
jgi:hypothetical protein